MIWALYRPLAYDKMLLVAVGIVGATAFYCLTYNALAGRSEGVSQAMTWAVINILPWYVAFEASKRSPTLKGIAASIAGALVTSMLLQLLTQGVPADLEFQLIRRIPSLLLLILFIGVGRFVASISSVAAEASARQGLPLAPHDFDWVSAAGNYVEFRSAGRSVLHRAPLSSVHAALEKHGFVRIHRSILVRRDKIARIRPGDVVLVDGTSLKTGKRYRSSLY